jgi:pimeloyl-ACP methyl ester carboxylesterase
MATKPAAASAASATAAAATDGVPLAKPKLPSMLAAFKGARPPAPAWFDRAIADVPERSRVTVAGADIEILSWGEVGAPGLLLLHGGMAHADWWSFIAPFFAKTHRVVAPSWSGMGGSEWRPSYRIDTYVDEMMAVAEATGVFLGPTKPVVLAHSFGGFPTMRCARTSGDRFGGMMILDSPVLSPAQRKKREDRRKDEPEPRDTRIYASEAEALSRFRFSPNQPCDNFYIVDFIARTSLRPVTAADGSLGWTWKFDPFMWSRLDRSEGAEDLSHARCRIATLWGGQSSLFQADVIDYVKGVASDDTLFIEIPEAHHHVMADEPLALVAAVRAVMAAWA